MEQKLSKAIILDVDRVFLDSSCLDPYEPEDHRDEEAWAKLYTHFYECIPNQWCVDLVNKYVNTHKIIFITSRSDREFTLPVTYNSLCSALGHTNFYLYLRKQGDYRPSHEVKKEIYLNNIHGVCDIDFAIDDEISNAKVWRELGIVSLHRIL